MAATKYNVPAMLLFAATWAGLMIHAWRLSRQETAATKRAAAMSRAVFVGGLFTAFVFVIYGFDWTVLWVVLPITLIMFMNKNNTYYCDVCNSAVYNGQMGSPLIRCPKCGMLLGKPACGPEIRE